MRREAVSVNSPILVSTKINWQNAFFFLLVFSSRNSRIFWHFFLYAFFLLIIFKLICCYTPLRHLEKSCSRICAMNLEVMETQVGRRDELIRAEVETAVPSKTLPSAATVVCNRDKVCIWFPRKQYNEKPKKPVLIVLFCTTVNFTVYSSRSFEEWATLKHIYASNFQPSLLLIVTF